jgi:hypothetical protein
MAYLKRPLAAGLIVTLLALLIISTISMAATPEQIITEKYQSSGGSWGLGAPVSGIAFTPDGSGRYQHYASGASIYWTQNTGARLIYGAIRWKWSTLGWEQSFLGYPITDELALQHYAGGRYTQFQSGYIYWTPSLGPVVAKELPGPNAAPWSCVRANSYVNNYPHDKGTAWSHKVQGITHDANYWYITQVGRLWQIPLSSDLNAKSPANSKDVGIPADLASQGYDHFGDLDYHAGLLYIPVEGKGNTLVPALAVFRADDLSYLGSAKLSVQHGAGWVAFNPKDGLLYSSSSYINSSSPVYIYSIDHGRGTNFVSLVGSLFLQNVTLAHIQGGDFSDDGCLLYMSNGNLEPGTNSGLRIFDASNGSLLQTAKNGSGRFNFEHHPHTKLEEPEGLDYGDLSGHGVPGVSGKLHVILLDHDALSDGEVFLKHYK